MGCLVLKVARLGGIILGASYGKCLSVMTKAGKGINVSANRKEGITLSCGLVCSVSVARYLNVAPEYIFLMPGNNFTDDVLVLSNVEWKVNV